MGEHLILEPVELRESESLRIRSPPDSKKGGEAAEPLLKVFNHKTDEKSIP